MRLGCHMNSTFSEIPHGETQLDLNSSETRGVLFHPVTLFLASWCIVVGLYSLHLSDLLLFDNGRVVRVALWVVVPFALTAWWAMAFYAVAPKKAVSSPRT